MYIIYINFVIVWGKKRLKFLCQLQCNRLPYDIRILKTHISFVKQANKNSETWL